MIVEYKWDTYNDNIDADYDQINEEISNVDVSCSALRNFSIYLQTRHYMHTREIHQQLQINFVEHIWTFQWQQWWNLIFLVECQCFVFFYFWMVLCVTRGYPMAKNCCDASFVLSCPMAMLETKHGIRIAVLSNSLSFSKSIASQEYTQFTVPDH